jgi:hypothetical protein
MQRKIINKKPSKLQLKKERFIYELNIYKSNCKSKLLELKHIFNIITRAWPHKLWVALNFHGWKKKAGWWLIHIITEGIIINYVLFIFWGLALNPLTVLAYGLAHWKLIDFKKELLEK